MKDLDQIVNKNITFILAIVFFTNSIYAQNAITGIYSRSNIILDTYEYYDLKNDGLFEYHKGASLGNDLYGSGTYIVSNDSVILSFSTSEPRSSGSHLTKVWHSKSDITNIKMSVEDFAGKPIKYATIIVKDFESGEFILGKESDAYGNIDIDLQRKTFYIECTALGYKSYEFLLKNYNNHSIDITLNIQGIGTPIWEIEPKVFTLKEDGNVLVEREKKGSVIFLKRKN